MQETTIESKLTKKDWLKEDAGKPDEHGCEHRRKLPRRLEELRRESLVICLKDP